MPLPYKIQMVSALWKSNLTQEHQVQNIMVELLSKGHLQRATLRRIKVTITMEADKFE